ncbi:hypothetical protein BDK51DRAFT_29634, partial [Blyttiomyces helicus]
MSARDPFSLFLEELEYPGSMQGALPHVPYFDEEPIQANPARIPDRTAQLDESDPAPLVWTRAPAHALPFDDQRQSNPTDVNTVGQWLLHGDGGERDHGADLATGFVWVPVGNPCVPPKAPQNDERQAQIPAVGSGAAPSNIDHQSGPTRDRLATSTASSIGSAVFSDG